MVYIFTGDGKGKTSAALGVAMRAALAEKEVSWIAWYKGRDWEMSEKSLSSLMDNLEMYWMGMGFHIKNYEKKVKNTRGDEVKVARVGEAVVVDLVSDSEHKKAAEVALKLAEEKIESGEYFLVVLDEVINAINDELITVEAVVSVLNKRGATNIVMTGRGAMAELVEIADLVTECKKVKHPFDKGDLAVKGLDF